jgi:CBS domain-containing protein
VLAPLALRSRTTVWLYRRRVLPSPIYVSRLVRIPLVAADGTPLGGLDDVVIVPAGPSPARVLGFVASVQRRRIFVNAARVGSIDATGVRLRSGTIDVLAFRQRPGEQLVVQDVLGRPLGGDTIIDVAIELDRDTGSYYAVSVAVGAAGPLRRRRTRRIAPWPEVAALFGSNPDLAEVAELRQMHAADVAERIAALPAGRRRQLAELMEDDRLADLLEELPEEEQLRIIEDLDLERAAHVLEEMEPDDAVDLLGEMTESDRQRLLAAMEPEESQPLRQLLTYDDDTAGGLMTPEPVILPFTATVAEALAVVREADLPVELAAQVFVVQPPTSTPTGRYMGIVPFQRLLREPPATTLEHCVFDDEPVPPDLPLREVAERLAAYDALAIPVCDISRRLIGAVTVDDVLDHVLPADWRRAARH